LMFHPPILRHATGYKLADDGADIRTIQAYLPYLSEERVTT